MAEQQCVVEDPVSDNWFYVCQEPLDRTVCGARFVNRQRTGSVKDPVANVINRYAVRKSNDGAHPDITRLTPALRYVEHSTVAAPHCRRRSVFVLLNRGSFK